LEKQNVDERYRISDGAAGECFSRGFGENMGAAARQKSGFDAQPHWSSERKRPIGSGDRLIRRASFGTPFFSWYE